MPTAAFTLYNQFKEDWANKVHDLFGTAGAGADTCKVMLSNAAPNVSTHVVRADVSELSTAGGYTSGGQSVANIGTRSGGTVTIATTDVTWVATAGGIGPFRYAIIYNDTPTSPADPLIGYVEYPSSITVNDGESFVVDFGASLMTLSGG